MSTTIADSAPTAADTSTAPIAAAPSPSSSSTSSLLQTFSLPCNSTIDCCYLRNASGVHLKALRAQSSADQCNFALLKADVICDVFSLQCAALKASLMQQRGKLKTKNVHSELCYYLGASSHIQSNIDFLTADATTKNVLLCAFDCDERKRRLLQTIIEPLAACVTPIEQLRQYADVQAIKKAYRVQPSELQKHPCASTAIVPIAATASSTAAATNATTISASILDTHYDALSHAVIGRIHVKQ